MIIHHDQVGFILGEARMVQYLQIHQCNTSHCMKAKITILSRCRKHIWQNWTSVHDNNSQSGFTGIMTQYNGHIWQPPTSYTVVKNRAFFPKIRNKIRMCALTTFTQHSTRSSRFRNQTRNLFKLVRKKLNYLWMTWS